MTLNEAKYAALLAATGATPPITINELECLRLNQLGYSGTLNEMWYELFLADGVSAGAWNQMAYEFLGNQGALGRTLNERWYQFWLDGGIGGTELISNAPALAALWVPRGGNAVQDAINAVDIKYVDDTGGAYLPLSTTTILSEALVDGVPYRIEWVSGTAGEFYLGLTSDTANKGMSSGLNVGDFKPQGSTDLAPSFLNINLLAGQTEIISHNIRVWKIL